LPLENRIDQEEKNKAYLLLTVLGTKSTLWQNTQLFSLFKNSGTFAAAGRLVPIFLRVEKPLQFTSKLFLKLFTIFA